MKYLYLKIVALLSLAASFCNAQNPSDIFTMQEAVELAIKNNPKLNSLQESIEIKKSEKWKAIGLYTPFVSYMREGILSGGNGFTEQRWLINQSIDFPLKSVFRINSIADEVEAGELNYAAEKNNLVSSVKAKYIDVLYAVHVKKLSEEQVRLSEELYDAVFSRVEAGVSSELELLKATIKLDESKNDLENSLNKMHTARYELFKEIGLDPKKQEYSIIFSDTLYYDDLDLDQEQILKFIDHQPALLSITSELNAADNKIKSAWSSYLPNLNFSYYWQDLGTGFNYNGYEIGLSVPLWFFANESKDVSIAVTDYKIIEWKKRDTMLGIKKEIEQAWHSFEASRETIRRFEDNIQKKAKDLVELTTEGYRLGDIGLLILLDAQETFLSSYFRYLSALRNYYLNLVELEKYLDRDLVY
jgi:cobalt-zinc-cadmium efflux system outer membrane protein